VPPHLLPDHWTLDNFAKAFASAPLLLYLWNSLVFAVVSTIFIILTSTASGYIFAKSSSREQLPVILVLATAIVPFGIYMVPLFLRSQRVKLVNTQITCSCPYGPELRDLFMRQNTKTSVPDELLDAARIDGMSGAGSCSSSRLLAPAIAALAILAFARPDGVHLAAADPQQADPLPVELSLSQFANTRGLASRARARSSRCSRP
jgi:multiple sugar transport system permease protein